MQNSIFHKALFCCILFAANDKNAKAQVYPPDVQLTFQAMPTVVKPAYLTPITDPTYGSTVVRITDKQIFETKRTGGLATKHHYAKDQPWNSDGTLIAMSGWPCAILNGSTFAYIEYIMPPAGPHTWSNTQPNIIYGTDDAQSIVKVDVNTDTQTTIKTFNEYTEVSYGDYEGNMSNDDRYMALQCKNGSLMYIVCYDMVTNTVVSIMNAPVWPNNCSMTQSGNYVIVQWNVDGFGNYQGVCAYNRSDMSFVRNLVSSGGGHYDYGYDTQGNEICVGTDIDRDLRGTCMVRIDNGTRTYLLSDSQMSWYTHISCRNLKRPGWAYWSEVADKNTQTTKPNYQKIFAVKLDPTANNNAVTETFAHVHHSAYVDYEFMAFGVPSRDGSIVMFRSDWMGGKATSEVNSYVAYMPSSTVGISDELSEDDITVFPNPSRGEVTINLGNSNESEIRVYNINGVAILNMKTTNTVENLDLSKYKGLLFIKIRTSGKLYSKKVEII